MGTILINRQGTLYHDRLIFRFGPDIKFYDIQVLSVTPGSSIKLHVTGGSDA